ncbi:MAG: hypothetical protein II120_04445 [Bacteroidales bacterium]|nr:hypothetical protein [Bacteroidales bacterium]
MTEKSKLGLDFAQVAVAKQLAKQIADQVQEFVDGYTTVTVERTLCRLIGIDGIDENEVPMPNRVVDALHEAGVLSQGVLYFMGNAILETGLAPQAIAERISRNELDVTSLPLHPLPEIQKAIQPYIEQCLTRIKGNVAKRNEYLNTIGEGPKPYLYIIVATGNIYEDVVQAQAGARQGADVIAVIRTTGQSLLDYVPYGATTEGFGGTFATQENFRIMRKALDEVGEEQGRYIRLCNYCSGLCMPEIDSVPMLLTIHVHWIRSYLMSLSRPRRYSPLPEVFTTRWSSFSSRPGIPALAAAVVAPRKKWQEWRERSHASSVTISNFAPNALSRWCFSSSAA